jgi:hypothetical protein
MATHVTLVRPGGDGLPQTLAAGKQLFATHYSDGSINLTMLLRGCEGRANYLAYVNRTEVDVVRGMFGWLARRVIEGRLEDEAGDVLEGLRRRFEGS